MTTQPSSQEPAKTRAIPGHLGGTPPPPARDGRPVRHGVQVDEVGPFVISTGDAEFAGGTDASNPASSELWALPTAMSVPPPRAPCRLRCP